MDPRFWIIIIAVVVAIAIAVAIWFYNRRQRSEELRREFGPEYERTVQELGGDRRRAEEALTQRKERIEHLDIHPLSRADQDRFAQEWRDVQARFVDNPAVAIKDADRLIGEVMRARGYPVGDFEQRATDISVDHAQVVENYRAAHKIALANEGGQASTEDLRQAMIHYRALFRDLLGVEEPQQPRAPQPPEQPHYPEAQQHQ